MTQTGSKTKIYIGLEAVEGTLPATLIPIEVDQFNENDVVAEAVRSGARNNIAAEHGSEVVQESSEVQLSGDVSDQVIGIVLAGAYGLVSTTADSPEDDVNTHDYSLKNDNNHPTFSIVFADEDVNGGSGEFRVCKGCTIGDFEVPLDPGAMAKFDVKFIGRSSEATTDPNQAYLDENFFTTPTAVFKIANDLAGLSGASALPVQTGKFMIGKNAKKQFTVGQGNQPAKCYNGRITARSEMTIEYVDKTYIDLERNNSKRFVQIEITSGKTIGASSNPKLVFTLPNCKVRELSRDRNVDEELRQSFALKCEDVINMTAQLINVKAGYVAD